MLRMVFEVRIEFVAATRLDDIEKPADVIVEKGDNLGQQTVTNESLFDFIAFDHLLEDQQMPLLVVLLMTGFGHEVENAPRKIRLAVLVGHRDIRDMLPRLIRDSRDHFENLELGKRSGTAVEEIQGDKQRAGKNAIPKAGSR